MTDQPIQLDLEKLAHTSMTIMCAAADGDTETISGLMMQVATSEGGPAAVYSLCCSWAEVVMRLGFGRDVRGGDAVAVMGVLSGTPDNLRQIAPEDAPPQYRSQIWATRFVAAYLNGNDDQTMALFAASMDDEERHVGDVVALIGMVGDVLRNAEQQRTEDGQP